MTIGKDSQAYKEASLCLKGLTEGLVVAIDPSIGSSSSQPGWAVYRASEYLASGTFFLDPSKSKPERLRGLGSQLRALYNKYPPDVLVYEQIPAQRHGGNAVYHASLLYALGVVLSVPGPENYVGITPMSWKSQIRETYEKSDENDAVEIGHIVIQLAYQIALDLKKKGVKNGKKK